MTNEILLVITLLAEYSALILLHQVFGKNGLFMWTSIATIAANIEVLMLVKAFGMEMTLGNILFASTFLVTDIVSELYGKEESKKAVKIGIATSISFVAISSSWLLYQPSASDFATSSIRTIFSNTPRLMLASLAVYVIVQFFDVWLYHKWWELTDRLFGNHDKFLWVRNNGSTILSQLLNSVLFNFFAFYGIYGNGTILNIIVSSFVIFLITSLADTPFIYMCRYMHRKKSNRIS
ncbi:MAG: queuosine precursor transporter [Hornefia sp.]|nr:queuosine precursor transporter [Hornefia sp.]